MVWATVAEAQLPGGAAIGFESSDRTVDELTRELEDVEHRLNLRLLRLEREVHGGESGGNGAGVR